MKGRRSLKSDMFMYEPYRKQTLNMTRPPKSIEPKQEEVSLQKPERGRIKKTRRVMRMFQVK